MSKPNVYDLICVDLLREFDLSDDEVEEALQEHGYTATEAQAAVEATNRNRLRSLRPAPEVPCVVCGGLIPRGFTCTHNIVEIIDHA